MSALPVGGDFSAFCSNLRMSDSIVATVQARYHAITKRINQNYWNSTSETSHTLYVGSYGRGTAIYTSDIDIVADLPWSVYTKYNNYSYNGQSALLQDLKCSLQQTYSSSSISGDGQVVDVAFTDGILFEIVPSFLHSDGQYTYPDTNNGGSWRTMNPKAEADAFNAMNKECNKNLKRLCRMARAWNAHMCVLIPGILIDTLAYKFLSGYEYKGNSYEYYDWVSRDFFQYLVSESDKSYWYKFGSGMRVNKKYSFCAEAKAAYALSLEAIEAYEKGYSYTGHGKWRDIYGTKFPTA